MCNLWECEPAGTALISQVIDCRGGERERECAIPIPRHESTTIKTLHI